jgi:hypothetical protein
MGALCGGGLFARTTLKVQQEINGRAAAWTALVTATA